MTDSNLNKEDRSKALAAASNMRSHGVDGSTPPERKFDRAKFEQLRNAMGRKKGRAPARAE